MSRRTTLPVVAVALVAALALLWWRRDARPGAPPAPVDANAGTGAGAPAPSTPGAPPPTAAAERARVRRLPADEHRRLAAQIAGARRRAQAARAAAPGAPAITDDVRIPLDQIAGPLQDALQQSISILAECYQDLPDGAPGRTAAAAMTLITDPEFGTVIDTAAIHDRTGQPIDPALDACLRDRIDELALPPFGTGGTIALEYTFRFD
ncbi:MAG: hypothetical protein IPL61_33970 [Myxococcales bacterium]|nr:hypothetical protein [Myxococcales bacterium]